MKKVIRTARWSRRLLLPALLVAAMAFSPLAAGTERRAAASDPFYNFQGTGRAHGVGMCMDGAYYRAKEGQDYRTILNFYYTGITFSGCDEARPVRVKGRDGQIRVWTLHDYLHHLQEEPDNYPMEELKALYVAARTYTLNVINRGKHAGEGFDICSSGDCCQACDENKNIAAYPNNNAAVDATAGQIMTYNGQPITAAYCGSCGGHSENSEDVWGGYIPYLRGKVDTYCQYSPRYSWGGTFRRSELEARFNAAGIGVGTLYVIDIYSRTPGGRVKYARLVGSGGTRTVSGGTLAGVLGFPGTKFDLVRPNFDEYVTLLNPNPTPANVTFTFMQPDGTTSDRAETVGANSRFTLKVNDCLQFREVSTRVTSDQPIIAERPMYFNCGNRFNGGSDSTGIPEPQKRWYFAEGYTGGSFESYIVVQNPQGNPADLRFTFMLPGGRTLERTAQAGPNSRLTLKLDDVPGLEDTEVSTLVECTNGAAIVAERSSYFDYYGCDGGTNAPGVAGPSSTWYLAEGYTGQKFDTYVLVQNPGDRAAVVDAVFMREDGKNIKASYSLPAHSRYTIATDRIRGLENAGFSTELMARDGAGIIAERVMYFDYNLCGLDDGHDSVGATAPAGRWYFAEGYTGGRFDTWLTIQNPEAVAADVRVTFNTPGGAAVVKEYSIPARTRFTLPVDAVEGLSDTEVSATVETTNGTGVIAERSVYFVYTDGYCSRDGGHNTIGATLPSFTWFFAEGYTGF